MTREVRTVLGDVRQVARVYEDGSIVCPWCHHPILPHDKPCPNPWCYAHPGWSPERLREHMAVQERKAAELQRHKDDAARARLRLEQDSARREAQVQEIRDAGQCVLCFVRRYGKRIKHRGPCPIGGK